MRRKIIIDNKNTNIFKLFVIFLLFLLVIALMGGSGEFGPLRIIVKIIHRMLT